VDSPLRAFSFISTVTPAKIIIPLQKRLETGGLLQKSLQRPPV
jgi:hypothetical protein